LVPDRLENWTYQTLEALCAAGRSESDRHDFKSRLQEPKGTTKICCAFANSFGGFLVIGISETSKRFEIEGVEPNKELYGQLIAKIKADPEIAISSPNMIAIPESTKLVYVFEIPQSPRRPHLPTPVDERVFWKRLGSDCVPMTLEEVRYQMNIYEEKREKLALLVMEMSHIVRSLSEQTALPDGAYNGSIFSFDIIDRVVVESYSILKSDPNTIGALDTLKKKLMMVNAEKQKLLSMMAVSYAPEFKKQQAINYKNCVDGFLPGVTILTEQIEKSLGEKFGIKNPYKTPWIEGPSPEA
jgi:hypothetical protein